VTIAPGDTVHFECEDSSGRQITPTSSLKELLEIDRGRIHALTGPVAIEDAEPGDVLEIEILGVKHKGWGWSGVVSGQGLLKDRFAMPYLFQWALGEEETRSLAPAVVPLRPFCGVMGVALPQAGEIRTQAPGAFGGNMDVRELCAGARLYLPVFNDGALFSCGDPHAAQGDGEVCLNGIECSADVSLRFHLHKETPLTGPLIESAESKKPDGVQDAWIVVESAEDARSAAKAATSRLVDLIASAWKMEPVHAYLLCSVAMKLRLSQMVNQPMTTVSAAMPKCILPPRKLYPVRRLFAV
jgi:acetamidase/formamidase